MEEALASELTVPRPPARSVKLQGMWSLMRKASFHIGSWEMEYSVKKMKCLVEKLRTEDTLLMIPQKFQGAQI